MLSEQDEEFTDPIFMSLYKQSLKIDEDLEFQDVISKREFHHEELCGWTVNQCDFYRFKWNLQRKLLKTPNKELKSVNTTPRRSFSRQSGYRNDIEFEFKHYQHRVNYIEQYRNEKIRRRQDPGLADILSQSNNDRRKSEACDQCTSERTSPCENSDGPIPKLVTEKSSAVTSLNTRPINQASKLLSSGLFQGKKMFSRPMLRHGMYGTREKNWKEIIDNPSVSLHNPAASHGMEESWTIVGVEKRPLPKRTTPKRTNLYSALSNKPHRRKETSSRRYQKYSTATNKCDAWVKNREQDLGGPYGCESFRIAPRSNSAPNIYNTPGRQSLWKSQEDSKRLNTSDSKTRNTQSQSTSSKMDYSCYTEMFKNVLEYYGTKKLQPKSKLPTNTENGRLLSVKT